MGRKAEALRALATALEDDDEGDDEELVRLEARRALTAYFGVDSDGEVDEDEARKAEALRALESALGEDDLDAEEQTEDVHRKSEALRALAAALGEDDMDAEQT